MSDTPYDEHFVSWFRAVTPYINAFRGRTFVIAFGGKAVASEFAKTLAYDVNPVSYTHLDVYKRQVPTWPRCTRFCGHASPTVA